MRKLYTLICALICLSTLIAQDVIYTTAGCLEIASIPCLAVGYAKMHKSVDIYNVLSASRAQCQPYWSIQANHNGIGLALNF